MKPATVTSHLPIDAESLSSFCQRHHIRRLSLYGSVLTDAATPDSDIDVLVEFEPGHVPSFRFISIQEEFSQILHGRRVDLVTPKMLNYRIRDQIVQSARPMYVAV